MKKLVRITTVPISLNKLLGGQLQFMSNHFNIVAISSDKEKLERVGANEGVATYAVQMTRKITPLKDLKALWQLYRYFRKHKPDIVHSHTPKAGLLAMMAAYATGVPRRLHTVAGLPLLESRGVKRKILNLAERLTYRCATRVYPNSMGLKNIIITKKFTRENKLKVIGNGSSNGINTAYFNRATISKDHAVTLKGSLAIQPSDFVFIYVGRLVGDKGINELVRAFEKLAALKNNVKLLLVGPYEEELDPLQKYTLNAIKNNNSIIATGYQDDVRPYFAIADILVFPSYREGFPNVIMQAGAMELASIVSDINGCNEIISEGINGYIIPPKNTDKLSDTMLFSYQNPDRIRDMGSAARKIIEKNYNQDAIWKALLQEYKSE